MCGSSFIIYSLKLCTNLFLFCKYLRIILIEYIEVWINHSYSHVTRLVILKKLPELLSEKEDSQKV